jgi:hypothetical protein
MNNGQQKQLYASGQFCAIVPCLAPLQQITIFLCSKKDENFIMQTTARGWTKGLKLNSNKALHGKL